MHVSRWLRRLALYTGVLVVCGVVFFPIYWMILTSIRPTRYTMSYPPGFLPKETRWQAYVELFQTIPIATWLRNTFFVSIGTTLICLTLAIAGAYALSRFRWRGRTIFGFALLATQMLPEALLVIPIFIIFRQLGLIDTLPGLALVDAAFVAPIGVWILKGFFDTVPDEVCEAALLDGCGHLGVLWRIILPLSLPALVAVGVVAFFDGWSEYLFASTSITTAERWVASIGLASFIGELATPIERVLAGATVFTVPPILFYLLMQRYIVGGLTGGAVKG
ncbi:MAG: carbohydrate ABC transporter permease [Chloroflexi bacterium]|nr:carbohydrate ABC transporter permease [Chloroflexota bacterium]